MSAHDVADATRRWLRYAQEDLQAARLYERNSELAPRHACFLAQQAAEKALKSILVFLESDFPYRHDLELLVALLPDDCELKHDHPDLTMLTGWAVEARYPGDIPAPTVDDADEAIRTASVVLIGVQQDLNKRGLEIVP